MSTSEMYVSQATSSRIPVRKHGIESKDDRKNRHHMPPRIQKTAILEKRALSSISKGFEIPKSTSGVVKMKPAMLKADKTFSPPKAINQEVSNPNKTLVKSAKAIVTLAALKRAAKQAPSFAGNAVTGAAESVGSSIKSVVQHAGGKKMRDFARGGKNFGTGGVEKFMSMPDADKISLMKTKLPHKEKEIKSLIRKRDASRVAVGVTGAAALYGAGKGAQKIKTIQDEREKRRMLRQYQSQYQNYYG